MQIVEKYHKEYAVSLTHIKDARRNFIEALSDIRGIRVIPSQANYIMVEITCGMTARELTKILLTKYNIFIKDLSGKVKRENRQYIRLAIRNNKDNRKLADALVQILG